MFESIDILLATAAVILGLSLVVQAIQQIVKQALDLKSTYMRVQLLALFDEPGRVSRLHENFAPLTQLAGKADDFAKEVVRQLEDKLRSFGFSDLHLLEGVDANRMKEIVLALPIAADLKVRDKVTAALDQVDRWFDISKKAFQEHYERRMKYWAFTLSAVVVVATNANLVGIVKEFNESRTVRQAAVAAAPGLMTVAEREAPPAPAQMTDAQRAALIKQKADVIDALVTDRSFQLVRWNTPTGSPLHSVGDFFSAIAVNFVGWLAMTLLVSLGAPFWYDILKSVMGVKDRLKGQPRAPAEQKPAAPSQTSSLRAHNPEVTL